MLPALVATVLFAQLASGAAIPALSSRPALRAAAAASPRPRECTPPGSGKQRSVWDQAHAPGLVDYCNRLARGYARLRHSPAAALASG